jgi:hypothetical protein
MRPLRYSINVTLDGCCDHRAISPDEELHRHAVANLDQAERWTNDSDHLHQWGPVSRGFSL